MQQTFITVYNLFGWILDTLNQMYIVNGVTVAGVMMVSGLSLIVLRNFLFGKG